MFILLFFFLVWLLTRLKKKTHKSLCWAFLRFFKFRVIMGWLAPTRSQRSCSGSWERAWPCRSAHHRPVARDRVSCVSSVSANQASPRRRKELIVVDGVLCTLPWAGRFGVSPGKPGLCSRWGPVGGAGGGGGGRGIITKHAADCSGTKAALTSSLLVASEGRSRSALTRLTRTTSHHSWGAETSCSITRHETDFFQLQWTGHKPRLTTSSAQTEQGEDGWARTEDKSGIGVEGVRVGRGRKSTL